MQVVAVQLIFVADGDHALVVPGEKQRAQRGKQHQRAPHGAQKREDGDADVHQHENHAVCRGDSADDGLPAGDVRNLGIQGHGCDLLG